MEKTGVIEILDEVNVRIKGVPRDLLLEARKRATWHVPGYIYTPTYRAGHWDGKVSLMSPTGSTFLHLLELVLPPFIDAGYDFDILDGRDDWAEVIESIPEPTDDMFADRTWDNGESIVLRDYQLAAVNAAVQNDKGVLEMATGAGKTLVCAAISKIYSEYGKVIIIVPNVDLVIQTHALFKDRLGLDAGMWYGGVKDRMPILISTWQSLRNAPEDIIEGVCAVIVDEAHQAKARVISEIMSGPAARVPFRFGCTGTIPKDALAQYQIKSVIGETIYQLKSFELQNRGVLAQADIIQYEMKDSHVKSEDDFESWPDQIKWMFAHEGRVAEVVKIIQELAASRGNTLVLVPYRVVGHVLEEAIEGSRRLDGGDKPERRKEIYEWFGKGDNEILICTFGIASTGLDIPRIKVLGFIEPGKKFEKVIQSVGRGLRKADDKQSVLIADIFGDMRFSKKHAGGRRTLYKEAKIPFSIEKVEYNAIH